jgi:hypothetical protein
MKTMKKAILGFLFLAPLLLPGRTRAGRFDDWIHSIFQNNQHQAVRPVPPGYGFGNDARNPFRQYDPYRLGGARPGQPAAGDPQDPGNSAPIDGGIVFLVIAGLTLGAVKVYTGRKRLAVAELR